METLETKSVTEAISAIQIDAGELPELDCSKLSRSAEMEMALLATEHPTINSFSQESEST